MFLAAELRRFFCLLAVTGMRLGEALGLQWNDVDWEKGTVTVQRSVNVQKREVKPDTKTAGSRRTLPLDAETLNVLQQLYTREKKGKVQSLQRNTLVFHAENDPSRPLREKAVRLTLARALAAAGLPHIRVHDLRHTAGSLLVAAGVPLPTVAEFLGHSSPATTAAVYAHAVGRKVNVADVLPDSQANSQTRIRKPLR
ncbi:MAG: site-specific integrase [Bacillota bacterium]